MNNSTFNDQSLVVTPNLSYGDKKLQNQLEQVLMMKSGEFSAGGPGAMEGKQYEQQDGILQNSEGRNFAHGQDQSSGNINTTQGVQHSQDRISSNYGNPNFIPPSQSQGSFNRDAESRGQRSREQYQERDPQYYKNQYPATFQQFEQNGSNHKNFTTS